jgi:hypothetical protein
LSDGSNAVALAGLARTCGSPMPVFYNSENLDEILGKNLKDLIKQKVDPKQRLQAITPNLCDSALKNINSF